MMSARRAPDDAHAPEESARQGVPEAASTQRRGIQSIEVGGTLLQALARRGTPMMLKDLASEAGMPAAKAHPYLVSFGKLGLIEQDALTGRYRLGPFALQMGLAALHALDPVKIAMQEAERLADDLQLSIAIAVWGNFGPTVIHLEEGNRPLHVNLRPGTVMTPLLLSATGRVFAAFMPERIVAPILADECRRPAEATGNGNGESMTDGPATSPPWQSAVQAPPIEGPHFSAEQARQLIAEARTHRLARAIGNPIPGINAFSAPVIDATGRLTLAITAMGADDRFDPDWQSPVARHLLACARQIEYRLGRREALPDHTARPDTARGSAARRPPTGWPDSGSRPRPPTGAPPSRSS
ncbi:MAG: IclR family transcriptional regulator [Lautropia sp.]|nr:IclR family transcriptional regulator [Lautropia sp.]